MAQTSASKRAEDLLEALKLVVDLSSQVWQEPDGTHKCALDNQGRRVWLINQDVMDEVVEAINRAEGK
jgi:hypothetical protein